MTAHLLLIGGEDHNLRMPFLEALRAKGRRVSIAASGDSEPFRRAGFEFHPFAFNRFWDPRSDLRAARALGALLRSVDADVAHAFDTKLGLLVPFASRANRRTKIVRTINGRGWTFSSRSPKAFALRLAYPALQRIAASFAAATVFEHRGDQEFFERRRLIGRGESVLIPGAGVDIAGFETSLRNGPSPQSLREQLGLVGAEVVITVTRVTRQKGVPTLLEAADIVHKARPSVRFLLVGPRDSEGPFGVSDAEIQQRAPYVIATGSRNDVPSLLAMSDLFAFPSEYAEGVPRALMEAALCSVPIVTTDLPGCKEVIRDGWNGRLAPQRDPRRFAECILDQLSHPERARSEAARGPETIRGRFSLDSVVEQHLALYDRLAAGRTPSLASERSAANDPAWARRSTGLAANGPPG